MLRYLYHYTSIETLEKILTNKTLAFSSLDSVDDLEEVETADINKFGRFCFVSCWTSEESESIPMWKMYTNDMQGVRIRMKEYPFKRFVIPIGKYANDSAIETFINVDKREEEGLPYILSVFPKLIQVDYTEREELLYPQIKTENITKTNEVVMENGKRKTVEKTSGQISFSTKYIGEFKRKCWEFQKEWRYKIFLSPYTFKELSQCKTYEDQQKLMQRLEDDRYILKEKQIFLELNDEAISEMEILIGPKASQEQVEKVFLLSSKYGVPIENISYSKLKIR